MKSIRDVYKIGKGPSSSHTMGPERAAMLIRLRNPKADHFRVVLYGSLSKTGKGHGTDTVIYETLSPCPTEIEFSKETPADMHHPNTMDLFAYEGNTLLETLRVESIGGGDIRVVGQPEEIAEEIYPENSFAEIAVFCKWRYITLPEYVEMNEGPEIWDFLRQVWRAMEHSIEEGLNAEGILPGGLNLERKAKLLYSQKHEGEIPQVTELRVVCSYALAVAEQNAANGTVVTAPTCGSCGVVPAALKYMQERYHFSEDEVIRALAVGGLIGTLVKQNASISGAECGCQAEIGTACSMAAAALCQLMGLPIEQVEYAAEIAMEHQLGLTCDPICGLVQIPCIERNAVAAQRALDAMNIAHFLVGTRTVSFDMVVRTMYETGIAMHQQFRETSEGGLARLYNRRKTES